MKDKLISKQETHFMNSYEFEVSRETINDEIKQLAEYVSPSYKRPGFRRGKVPINLIVQDKMGEKEFYSHAIENAISTVMKNHIDIQNILKVSFSPLSNDRKTKINLWKQTQDWQFLKKKKVIKYEIEIDDKTIKHEVEKRMKSTLCREVISDREIVQENDIIKIEHLAYNQKLCSEIIFAGTKHWSIGLKINEIYNSFLDESVLEEIGGQEAQSVFFIPKQSKVLEIYKHNELKINDENAKQMGFKSLQDMNNHVKTEIEQNINIYAHMLMHKSVLDMIADQVQGIEITNEDITKEFDFISQNFLLYMHHEGADGKYDDFCKKRYNLSLAEVLKYIMQFCHKKHLIKYILIIWSACEEETFNMNKYNQYIKLFSPENEAVASNQILQFCDHEIKNVSYDEIINIIEKHNQTDELAFLIQRS